jgi:alpha-tubulin suppressor-like RCC1 family protein
MFTSQAACGENFSVLLDSDGFMYSAGLGEFGQLGNGETGEYFIAANKIGFANSTKFERRSVFVHKPDTSIWEAKKPPIPLPDSDHIRIGSIACGKQHTVAVEAPLKNDSGSQRVFTWGCGGYGVLGHGEQVDQYTPQLINTFLGPLFKSNSPIRACAGAHCSLVLTGNGHVYYCGKHRSVGEATMRPALVDVLANNAHVVTALDAGGQTVVCSTQNGVTVSWGVGQTGELGYGAGNPKSSAKPKFLENLDSVLVTDVSCGYGHTLFLIRNEDNEDKKVLAKIARIETDELTPFIKKWSK